MSEPCCQCILLTPGLPSSPFHSPCSYSLMIHNYSYSSGFTSPLIPPLSLPLVITDLLWIKHPLFQQCICFTQFTPISKTAIITKRHQLFRLLSGDTFYPISCWPREIQSMFWKKPIGDVESFKLVLFFVGNGCSPHLISEWILSSQLWNNFQKAGKRSRQIDFILKKIFHQIQ